MSEIPTTVLRRLTALGIALPLLLTATLATAQSNKVCLNCHKQEDLTGTRDGKEVSFHVDAEDFGASSHKDKRCVECHEDLAGEKALDHGMDPEETKATPVNCAACHPDQAKDHAASLHGQAAARDDPLAPTCADCHSKHAIRPHTDPGSSTFIMNIPVLCGRCHQEGTPVSETRDIPQHEILRNYSMSIHGAGLYRQGLVVTAVCTSCHTSHRILPHTDPTSSISPEKVADTCQRCHAQIEQVHVKVIEGRKWEEEPHRVPVCVECHAPHRPSQEKKLAVGAGKCLRCHGDDGEPSDRTVVRDGVSVELYVDPDTWSTSAHASGALSCRGCHDQAISVAFPDRGCRTIQEKVDCSTCHAQEVNDYRTSTHGVLLAVGDADAPTCLTCHNSTSDERNFGHAILSKDLPISRTFSRNVPKLCAQCHRAGQKAAERIHAEVDDIVGSYEDSIHGRGLIKSGLTVTATCADCHSAHRELPPTDPRSTIHRDNVAGTCGTCHHGIEETFRQSVHWPGNTETDRELPTCEDCHSSHTIGRHDSADFRFRMMDQCGRCHAEEAETFFDTYHGKVSMPGEAGQGNAKAAKCYDCHGTHDILPTEDPRSSLSRDNVVETCAKCHPGAHRRFAGYLTHATHHDRKKYPWLFWSFWIMAALLIGTLSLALVHTAAWLYRLLRTRPEWKAHVAAIAAAGEQKLVRRFTKTQRSLHLAMMLSFFTLALTGMALKFSYMGWAQFTAGVLGGFESMGTIHRVGAAALFIIFVIHLRDLGRRRRAAGKTWLQVIFGPETIMFTRRDLKEFLQSMKWFLGRGPRPSYGRFTYWEKFDYFAVFWGIAVIGNTGLILWFPELFTYILPGQAINVATIIHSDEALLAVGFIFTIHFFNTHFRPDKFPMDPVIFTGRVPLEELKYDKPGEYQRLVDSGELEQKLVDPIPEPAERAFRIFGFLALGVGLSIIAAIVYTMLLGYK